MVKKSKENKVENPISFYKMSNNNYKNLEDMDRLKSLNIKQHNKHIFSYQVHCNIFLTTKTTTPPSPATNIQNIVLERSWKDDDDDDAEKK